MHLFDKRFDAHGKWRGEFQLYNNGIVMCNGEVHVPADDISVANRYQGLMELLILSFQEWEWCAKTQKRGILVAEYEEKCGSMRLEVSKIRLNIENP